MTEQIDDLTKIKGIGTALHAKLNAAGVKSFAAILAIDEHAMPADIEALTTPANWADWRAQAAELVEAPNNDEPKAKSGRTRAVLVVRAKQDRRRRAGHDFGKETVELNAADLSEDEIKAIENDPVLITSREERPELPADE